MPGKTGTFSAGHGPDDVQVMVVNPESHPHLRFPELDGLRLVLDERQSGLVEHEAGEVAVAVECGEVPAVKHLGIGVRGRGGRRQ